MPWAGNGTIFKMTPAGALTKLVSFGITNGAKPYAGLVQTPDGNLYGTTSEGGTNNQGTIFRVTTNGVLTLLCSFNGTNGAKPTAKLLLASDGYLYGTTFTNLTGRGTVFRISTNGTLTTLAVFNNTNGAAPFGELIQGMDGVLYGTTIYGGTNGNWGTVFKLTTNGTLTTLFSFSGTNGSHPYGGLVQDTNGILYGSATYGGLGFDGSDQGGNGTIFKISTNGTFQLLYLFSGGNDGLNPWPTLLRANDGNFYGATTLGGLDGFGTVFQIRTDGAFTSLYSFAYDENGISPYGQLLPGPYDSFYGTTSGAGIGYGTVFHLSPSSTLQISKPSGAPVTLNWDALPGLSYQVQYATNLSQGGWFNLGGPIIATNGTMTTTDSTALNASRHYRIVLSLFP